MWRRKKRTKYNAQKTVCRLGHYHNSLLESRYCTLLYFRKRAGEIIDFVYEKSYDFVVNGVKVGAHKPDFTIILNDGSTEVHEVKGFETTDWKLRRALFELLYPDIPYKVIKYF